MEICYGSYGQTHLNVDLLLSSHLSLQPALIFLVDALKSYKELFKFQKNRNRKVVHKDEAGDGDDQEEAGDGDDQDEAGDGDDQEEAGDVDGQEEEENDDEYNQNESLTESIKRSILESQSSWIQTAKQTSQKTTKADNENSSRNELTSELYEMMDSWRCMSKDDGPENETSIVTSVRDRIPRNNFDIDDFRYVMKSYDCENQTPKKTSESTRDVSGSSKAHPRRFPSRSDNSRLFQDLETGDGEVEETLPSERMFGDICADPRMWGLSQPKYPESSDDDNQLARQRWRYNQPSVMSNTIDYDDLYGSAAFRQEDDRGEVVHQGVGEGEVVHQEVGDNQAVHQEYGVDELHRQLETLSEMGIADKDLAMCVLFECNFNLENAVRVLFPE